VNVTLINATVTVQQQAGTGFPRICGPASDVWPTGCRLRARSCLRSNSAAYGACGCLFRMAVVHVGCCTSLLYGMAGASKRCPCSVDCLRRCKRTRQRLRSWLITLWRGRHVMAPAHPLATCAVSLGALHIGSAPTIEGAGRAVYRFGKLRRRLTCLIDLLKPMVVVPDSDGEQAENATAHAHPTSVPGSLGSCQYTASVAAAAAPAVAGSKTAARFLPAWPGRRHCLSAAAALAREGATTSWLGHGHLLARCWPGQTPSAQLRPKAEYLSSSAN
jgi:hypothetical protein